MQKIALVVAAVVLLAIGYIAGSNSTPTPQQETARTKPTQHKKEMIPFEYQTPVPKISVTEARDHRQNNYAALSTVGDVLELPSDFAETEALFTIAGRANALELEELILQSMRVVDRYDRQAALDILFSRYTEMDPHAAVAFLQSINLDIDDQIIRSIFINWAKLDLQGAIAAANQISNVVQRKKAGYAVLTAASRHNYGNLDAIASQLADRHDTAHLHSNAIGLRANYDPASALFEALGMRGDRGRYDAIRRIGIVWARNDPDAAIAAAENIQNGHLREQYLSSIYQQWIADDPDGAIQNVLGIANPQVRNQQLQRVLHSYAGVNPADSMALAAQLKGQARNQAYSVIFEAWIGQDPDAALQAFATLEQGTVTDRSLIMSMAQRLSMVDADQALAWADTLKPQDRGQVLNMILGQLAQSDPQRAIEAALATPSASQRQQQVGTVIQHLSHSNPQLALQYIQELPAGSRRDQLYQSIASQWAATDTQAALAWVSTLTGQAYVQAIGGMATRFALEDPQQAASMLRQIPAESRGPLLHNIASVISRHAPHEALTWLGQFSNESTYDSAVVAVLHSVAQTDPQYALNVAGTLRSEYRFDATRMALSTWAHQDPAAAARWASGSDTELRSQAVGVVTSVWGRAEPMAALRWAQTLRSGDARDNAMASLLSNPTIGPADVTRIISSIDSDQIRDQAISTAFFQLHQAGTPRAAEDFLERVRASEELKRALLSYGGG